MKAAEAKATTVSREASTSKLREQAEKTSRKEAPDIPENLQDLSAAAVRKLLHELRVHQIELRMQNDELSMAREKLETSRALYFDLYDLAPVGYFSISEQGLILEANLTGANLLRAVPRELRAQSFTHFIFKDDQDIYYLHRMHLFQTRVPQVCELRMVRKDGSLFWARVEATVAQDGKSGKPVYLGTISDISDSKHLEEERQRLAKLESVGVLAGGISHDFNNILTAILGNISLAMMEAAPGSELQNSLEQAEKASLRAKDLTMQLLTFSRGGAPVTKLDSLTELLKDTASFALSGSNVRCQFSIPADLRHAEIDSGQISQVIHNLVVNAQQSMPAGGTIDLRAENMTLSKTQSLGRGLPLKSGDYIRISVTDQGTGIPVDHLGKIFDPFFSTKQRGSGLGLATSFSIARQHGGHLSVESEMGLGSTFYLYLAASPQTPASKHNSEPLKAAGKARVLVMDDEEAVREVAGRMLKRIGYQDVEFAADGAETIKLCKAALESGNPFTVVILDLTIPGGMGGKETVKKLIKIDPGVRAIVSSGYVDDSVLAGYGKYGFSGMVAKPYTIAELGKALQDVMG